MESLTVVIFQWVVEQSILNIGVFFTSIQLQTHQSYQQVLWNVSSKFWFWADPIDLTTTERFVVGNLQWILFRLQSENEIRFLLSAVIEERKAMSEEVYALESDDTPSQMDSKWQLQLLFSWVEGLSPSRICRYFDL